MLQSFLALSALAGLSLAMPASNVVESPPTGVLVARTPAISGTNIATYPATGQCLFQISQWADSDHNFVGNHLEIFQQTVPQKAAGDIQITTGPAIALARGDTANSKLMYDFQVGNFEESVSLSWRYAAQGPSAVLWDYPDWNVTASGSLVRSASSFFDC